MDCPEVVAEWWRTKIIDMEPGRIALRGYAIEDLIENASFIDMMWLMCRGDMPSAGEKDLLQKAMIASVDHGPQAPSIAVARMAVTCGLGLNGALASAVNLLDDVHGGAGEQAVDLFCRIARRIDDGAALQDLARDVVCEWTEQYGKIIPGYGHRFHKNGDPRSPVLMNAVRKAAANGVVSGRFVMIAEMVGRHLEEIKGRMIPLNIDGATAVIFAELGFEGPLARGLFCLSRSVGILAHAWEQHQQGGRNKGPTPPAFRWKYEGQPPRKLNKENREGNKA